MNSYSRCGGLYVGELLVLLAGLLLFAGAIVSSISSGRSAAREHELKKLQIIASMTRPLPATITAELDEAASVIVK